MEYPVKQVIIARKDINMPPGKLAAQVAHAAIGSCHVTQDFDDELVKDWLASGMKKAVLEIETVEELLELYYKAVAEELPLFVVLDAGRTVFTEPTITCLGIGPMIEESIDRVTGHLKLYAWDAEKEYQRSGRGDPEANTISKELME